MMLMTDSRYAVFILIKMINYMRCASIVYLRVFVEREPENIDENDPSQKHSLFVLLMV